MGVQWARSWTAKKGGGQKMLKNVLSKKKEKTEGGGRKRGEGKPLSRSSM